MSCLLDSLCKAPAPSRNCSSTHFHQLFAADWAAALHLVHHVGLFVLQLVRKGTTHLPDDEKRRPDAMLFFAEEAAVLPKLQELRAAVRQLLQRARGARASKLRSADVQDVPARSEERGAGEFAYSGPYCLGSAFWPLGLGQFG